MDHVFIAVKPSSLDSGPVRMLEFAAIRTDGSIGVMRKHFILGAFSWPGGPPFKDTLSSLKQCLVESYSEKCVIVTLVSDVTRGLLRAELGEELFSGRSWIDLNQLAWPLVLNRMIESRSIESLAKHFAVTIDSDSAVDMCTALTAIYGLIMQRYKTALTGEEAVRDLGGETLESIRKMVGF